MCAILDKIRSRGHWQVLVRPAKFARNRIGNIVTLAPIVERCSVRMRGWDYPHIEHNTQPILGLDWASQEFEWEHYREFWRLYQSGQFVHIFGMVEDWRTESSLWPTTSDFVTGNRLAVGNALFLFTEIFEFAARLAQTEAGDDLVDIKVVVHGLRDRILWLDSRRRMPFSQAYRASIPEFPYSNRLTRAQLVSETRDAAVLAALELFRRFGWDPPLSLLRELQSELVSKWEF